MVCKVTPKNTPNVCRTSETRDVLARDATTYDVALHLTGYGRLTWTAGIGCAGAFFAAGVQNALSAYVLPASACELQLSTYRIGLVNVAFMCGGVASAFLWGIIADIFGLKRTLVLTLLLDSALTLAQSFVREFHQLLLARAFNGFVIGGPSTLVMTYVSDLVGERRRQMCLNATGLSFMMAWLILPGMAWALIPYEMTWLPVATWRVYLAACSLPGFVAALWLLFLPESPRLLLDNGRGDVALEILKRMFRANTGRNCEEFPVKNLLEDPTFDSTEEPKRRRSLAMEVLRQLRCLVSKNYAVKSTIIAFVFFANMAAGFGLSMWIPELLDRMNKANGSSECATPHRINDNFTLVEVPTHNVGAVSENQSLESHLCKPSVNSDVYISGLIVGACCVLGNVACSLLCALGSKGVRRASAACALACAAACVAVFACVCSCIGGATFAVAAVATLNAAALNGNVLLMRLLLYALPPRLSALGVCWGAWWGRAGGVGANLAIGALLDASCAAPFIAVAILLAVSVVGIMMVRDADSEAEITKSNEPHMPKGRVANGFYTTHM